ncbi:MAG TPA: hypothetical protein VFR24_27540 [Candidatus Angelobacter sp.]|nr:hypothetical protein [Candidatus Angelobacter sp.]
MARRAPERGFKLEGYTTMSKTNDVTGWYSTVLKGWQVKLLGPKVTAELLSTAHALGCRPGKQALAMAMYLREGGASDGQVKAACIIQWGSSGSHHNKRRDLVDVAKLARNKPIINDAQGHKVYAITLTDKGVSRVKAAGEAATAAAAAKPAKAAKPRKAKPETPAATVPVTATQPAAEQPTVQ